MADAARCQVICDLGYTRLLKIIGISVLCRLIDREHASHHNSMNVRVTTGEIGRVLPYRVHHILVMHQRLRHAPQPKTLLLGAPRYCLSR
jgi:hypothetical protein